MNKDMFEPVITIAAGVIGLAIIAILVSKNAQTSSVIGAAGSAFSNVLSAAEAPVTGAATRANVNGPNSGGLSMLGGVPSLGGLTSFGLGQ